MNQPAVRVQDNSVDSLNTSTSIHSLASRNSLQSSGPPKDTLQTGDPQISSPHSQSGANARGSCNAGSSSHRTPQSNENGHTPAMTDNTVPEEGINACEEGMNECEGLIEGSSHVGESSAHQPKMIALNPSVDRDVPVEIQNHNRHHMLTRSKCGIFKPKAYLVANEEPSSVHQAL
ncbi:hypothetical protein V6N11_054294 [Hibiscus sabdariffa]|uniref:Uncharacterized protein n=1 Tax=Hibiscus sabdariffa TaxID=183260 RepID=A0ABR2S3F8_9ROSI